MLLQSFQLDGIILGEKVTSVRLFCGGRSGRVFRFIKVFFHHCLFLFAVKFRITPKESIFYTRSLESKHRSSKQQVIYWNFMCSSEEVMSANNCIEDRTFRVRSANVSKVSRCYWFLYFYCSRWLFGLWTS